MPHAVYIGVFSTEAGTLGNYNAKPIAGQRRQLWYAWHGERKGEYIVQALDVFPSLRGEDDPAGPRVMPLGLPKIQPEKQFRQNFKAETRSRIPAPEPLDYARVEKEETAPASRTTGETSKKPKTALDMAQLTLDDILDEAENPQASRRMTNSGYTLDTDLPGASAVVKAKTPPPPARKESANAAARLDKVLRDDFTLHMTRYAKGRKKEALQAFTRILENTEGLVPAHKHAFTDFGRDLRRIRLLDLAEKFYRRAQELAPDDANAAFNLARVLFESGKHAQALEEINRALELSPDLECAQKLQQRIKSIHARHFR